MKLNPTLNNLFVRAISGAVLVAVLLSATLFSVHTKFAIFVFIALVSLAELLGLTNDDNTHPSIPLTLVCGGIISLWLYLQTTFFPTLNILWIVAPLFLVRASYEIFRKDENIIKNLSIELFALCYILAPMLLLAQVEGDAIVALLFMVWSNDVGAYVVGVSIGKHRLAPSISPKKSWEGFWGGLLISMAVAVAIGHFYFGQSMGLWAAVGLVISLAAVFGDLFESALKRKIGVKDSGDIIPGHGGFLDRFDALFFAAPLFYVLWEVLKTGADSFPF